MLTLIIRFGTNVRMGSGVAAGGLDEAIDRGSPLSSGGVKGVLRDEARWLLPSSGPDDHPLVQAVFGTPRIQCPWNIDVKPSAAPRYTSRAGLQLDADGTIVPGALLVKEEASIGSARIVVVPRSERTPGGLDGGRVLTPAEIDDYHLALLHVSARAIEKLGQRRSRGLGWCSVECPDRDIARDLDIVWALRAGGQR